MMSAINLAADSNECTAISIERHPAPGSLIYGNRWFAIDFLDLISVQRKSNVSKKESGASAVDEKNAYSHADDGLIKVNSHEGILNFWTG